MGIPVVCRLGPRLPHVAHSASLDPDFAKQQLVLFLREWYMHPNGQLPAYEFSLGDVNPPVHAWACWRVYKMTAARDERDRVFLSRCFQKLIINFTWWVNRKDIEGKNLFAGGFLGLDNIGVFDRSKPLPTGGHLDQADGTAWMAFYCATMLSIALELARDNPATEDMASKFFEHFVAIADAINTLGGTGLWDEEDGFYYDQLYLDGTARPAQGPLARRPHPAARRRSPRMTNSCSASPASRSAWTGSSNNRPDLNAISSYYCCPEASAGHGRRLLAIPSRQRLERVLRYILDENEFLSPYGIRSVSQVPQRPPLHLPPRRPRISRRLRAGRVHHRPVRWQLQLARPRLVPHQLPLIEALERYHHFYGDTLHVECPTGSGKKMNLQQVADELKLAASRASSCPTPTAAAPATATTHALPRDPHWRDLVLFHEYFHGETGRGLGASHQTGWTALIIRLLAGATRTAACN